MAKKTAVGIVAFLAVFLGVVLIAKWRADRKKEVVTFEKLWQLTGVRPEWPPRGMMPLPSILKTAEEKKLEAAIQTQQDAEAERKRQAEEKAKEIKAALGDEIEAQVSYLGLAQVPGSAPANVANEAEAYLDQVVGYKLRNLRMFVNRTNGTLTIAFDCQFGNGQTTPTQMLVRLFDANGAYLTHFVTEEWFVAPNARFNPPYHIHRLQQGQNSLQYSVNIRDAAYAQKAEFGWYLGR